MNDIISPILQWINAHPHLAGIATFIISAAESVAIIGTIVPGSVMMTAIGALAGAGVMPLWSTILWAILGAIVGDGISYWIGHKFKKNLHQIWPFRTHPNFLLSGEAFFHKYGAMSVFIGRFVGPVRALVPLVAGMLGMKPLRFYISNITSAIAWAPAYMLPGIALGAASLELPPDIAGHVLLMFLLITLFIILCIWTLYKLFFLISDRVNQSLTSLWKHLHSSRFFSPITSGLKHHDSRKTYGQLTLTFYLIIISAIFVYLAIYVRAVGSDAIFINQVFLHFFRSIRTPVGDVIMLHITFLGETAVIVPVACVVFLWLAWKKRFHTAVHILALMILTVILAEFFKHSINSARPFGIAVPPTSPSFPSGHTINGMVFYLGFILLFVKALGHRFYRSLYFLAGLLVAAIGISRIYLNAHWFTDVIGGVLLGAAILMIIVISYNRKSEKNIPPSGLFYTFIISLLIIYSIFSWHNSQKLTARYQQIDWPVYTITQQTWWNHLGNKVPMYRLNRFGLETQVLNIQWIGNLDTIQQLLLKNGWEIPPSQDWVSVLRRISDIDSAEHLPLVSPLYLDKNPVLVLIKQQSGNKKLIVLRLWESNITIANSNKPLWVGTVEMVPRTFNWLFQHKPNDVNLNVNLVMPKTTDNDQVKEITVINNHKRHVRNETMLLIKPKE